MTMRRLRAGLTLIELMVVIGVIGLLMALTIPAVLSSAEASRRTGCSNNLRQIGLVLNSYHSVFNVFPAACGIPNYGTIDGKVGIAQLKQYSVFTQLLSQVDNTAIFNTLNFSNALDDFYRFESALLTLGVEQNDTAFGTVISVFTCPSDAGRGAPGRTGGTSYRVNLGTGDTMTGEACARGPISAYRNSSYADIVDGSSNTVAFSERPMGGLGRDAFSPNTDYVRGNFLTFSSSPEESLSKCASLHVTRNNFETTAGLTWAIGTFGQTCYTHAAPPNYKHFDCETSPSHPVLAVITARSYHPHGVHVVYASGAARFCTDAVDVSLWRALATRAGQEIISDF